MSNIRVKVKVIVIGNHAGAISETLQLSKVINKSLRLEFETLGFSIVVWPESCDMDLQEIYRLNMNLIELKRNNQQI